MKICVIGGTGNISPSLVRDLLEQGHEVTCVNRGQSGEVPKGASWMQGDRRDRAAFERTMQGKPCDAAIDMLCFDRETEVGACVLQALGVRPTRVLLRTKASESARVGSARRRALRGACVSRTGGCCRWGGISWERRFAIEWAHMRKLFG